MMSASFNRIRVGAAPAFRILLALLAGLEALAPASAPASGDPFPPRPSAAETGSEFARRVAGLPLPGREAEIAKAILAGNIPGHLRLWRPVRLESPRDGGSNVVTLRVAPDYLAVGSDDDWVLMPMMPSTAQRIADALGCSLPTPRMVDAIFGSATVRLEPRPMPPGPAMVTVPMFERHSGIVRAQLPALSGDGRAGGLIAGHKKDVVISNRLTNAPGNVAIYGWHRSNGVPIQPLYLGHAATWVDYSHGVRLVSNEVLVNGRTNVLSGVLRDATLAGILSGEGVMADPRYPEPRLGTNAAAPPVPGTGNPESPPAAVGGEVLRYFDPAPSVRGLISAPREIPAGRPLRLILYALPNGNTIEQTLGRRAAPGDDWHYEIQHIGAQTRFLREVDPGHAWVVVYLEAEGLAWPAWRRRFADSSSRIVSMVDGLAEAYRDFPVRLVLSGHSGGGSFIFGYLNGVTNIPDRIERIAFLDANYAYDPALGHAEKLSRWLGGATNRYLSVLAYNDAVALLDGKPFVSAAGGTWGRSQLMLTNLGTHFAFERRAGADRADGADGADGLVVHRALDGRLQLLLKENPERKILHTVQVARNGFIHAMLAGTRLEGRGYRYFGEAAYDRWILPKP